MSEYDDIGIDSEADDELQDPVFWVEDDENPVFGVEDDEDET